MNDDISTNTIDDGPIYLNEISCSPYSKAEWFSDRCDQLQRMLAEMADRCRQNDVELDRLHKIAACIKWGDSDRLAWIIHNYPWTIGDEKTEMLRRLQEAAKLAEDSCK